MTQITGAVSSMMLTPSSQNALTDEQTQSLDDLLSEYDTENLSNGDAETIVSSIAELGITPGKELADALSGYGIDARELGDQAGVERPQGPRPGGGQGDGTSGVNEEAYSVLESVLETLKSSEESSSTGFQELLMAELEAAGLDPTSPIMDIRL